MLETGILTTVAIESVKSIVASFVKPALTRFFKSLKREYSLNIEHVSNNFEQYLSRTYEKNSILNTLVYRNQQRRLRDLYIPLTLLRDGEDVRESNAGIKIENYPKEFISQYRRILITDTAGMGKSTLTKLMFLSAIDQEAGIPFYIELRKLSSKHKLLDEIREQLDSLTKEFDDSLMRAFFQTGGFIFFFDGYDKVGLDERKTVTDDLKLFIEKAPNNYYILTSRYEQSLAGFGDFLSMRIQPLKRKEAFDLLRKYDSNGETSNRLIEKISQGGYQKITEFLKNPLLVSLLFIGFEYKPEIPLKIHLFYNQVFEAYFNSHDLSKDASYTHEKLSGLDMADFEKMLRAIGYICLRNHRLEFSRTDFLDIIDKAGKLSCISLKSCDSLMHDLLHAVPLFCQDGVYYKWAHKSMQEYFAADFICRDSGINKETILRRIAESPEISNYINLIELYSDLDSKSFQKIFVLPILDDFINNVERPIECDNQELMDLIRIRRQIVYSHDSYLYIFSKVLKEESIKAAFDILRAFVDNKPTHGIISQNYPNVTVGFVYVADKNERIVELIISKFPEIKYTKKEWGKTNIAYFEKDKPYHITEETMLDSIDAYKAINDLSLEYLRPILDYNSSKILREKINNTLRDNEDVFTDLMGS